MSVDTIVNASIGLARARLARRFDGESDESALALYDATRGAWVISLERVAGFDFALAVQDGVVREVYRIAAWLPAGSTTYFDSPLTHAPRRFEFVGRIAESEVRERYRFRSVLHLFPRGAQNPIRYFAASPG